MINKSFDHLMNVYHETLTQNKVLTGFLHSYYRHMLREGDRRWRHFVGSVDGDPVTCAAIHLNGETAGIYNVGTLEAFRKRGFGSAMTVLPLLQAREAGCRWAVLHSSPLGLPVYKRIGFEEICSLRAYLPA